MVTARFGWHTATISNGIWTSESARLQAQLQRVMDEDRVPAEHPHPDLFIAREACCLLGGEIVDDGSSC